MDDRNIKTKGFTLLEILLVLAILSSLVILMLNYTTQKAAELRRDKTVLQMQQILTAGLSYYINNSIWPLVGATPLAPGCGTPTWSNLSVLQTGNSYLPTTLVNSPYGNTYTINCAAPNNAIGAFYVTTRVDTAVNASIIAGRLPLAFITTIDSLSANPIVQPAGCQQPVTKDSNCNVVVSSVNIPGQNLNNARSVNFSNIYHSGSCVPAPTCPPGMAPSIFVNPVSVSGVNDATNIYPISSFTAYATTATVGSSQPVDPVGGNGPPLNCLQTTPTNCVADGAGNVIPADGTKYWRVCLSVTTSKGLVVPSSNAQGLNVGSVVAFTRCVPNNGQETPSGSQFDVWQN